jgi:DNA-binding SARP family transcriptional activator
MLAVSRPLSKEEIGEALWPDMDYDQSKLRFKNELYRLRHALGQEVVLFENDFYHFNRLLDYDYDVENFSVHLAKAKDARGLEDRISNLHIATGSRNGPYLQDMDATWIPAERERLDRACITALRQLIDSYRQKGDLQAALHACQEALKIDVCREDFHRLAMQLCADLGDRLAVIWQYQACRKALREEQDVDPSEETEALYRRLTA